VALEDKHYEVQYFKKQAKQELFTLLEPKYLVLEDELKEVLPSPEVVLAGRRKFYR
jgi:hypothetical protein